MSENIRSVLTNRRENGYHIGSFAPYGYKKDPERKGHLIIDQEAAEVVRDIFTLFVQGYGKTAIARLLNQRGIPNPAEYKRLQGFKYKTSHHMNSRLWRYSAVADILTNRMYIGDMVQGKYGSISYKTKVCQPRPKDQWIIVESTHEPVVDRVLWNRVQSMIKERAKPFASGKVGIFARKVYCGYCGCVLRTTKNRDKYYLQCQTKHISKEVCIGTFVPVAELEQIVIGEMNRLADGYVDMNKLKCSIDFSAGTMIKQERIKRNITIYKRRSELCAKALRELYMDKITGILSENDFEKLSHSLRSDRECLDQLIIDSEKELTELNERLKIGEDTEQAILRYIKPKVLNRQTVDDLIQRIVIYRRDQSTSQIPVEIYWNF